MIVSGYRGDFTNTFAVGGGPTAGQHELFEACVGALHAGEARSSLVTAARDVDAAVRGHFAALGLDQYFPTHSGHGLGLGHPEPPYFVPESSDTLQAGDVVALEPGLYVEGTGGMRYERNYLITADGFETLSNHEIRISAMTSVCRSCLLNRFDHCPGRPDRRVRRCRPRRRLTNRPRSDIPRSSGWPLPG